MVIESSSLGRDRLAPVEHTASDILDVPVVKEGDPIPMVFGSADIIKPHLEWFGDAFTFAQTRLDKDRDTVTVGPAFYITMHFILCLGYLDKVIRVNIDRSPLLSGGTYKTSRGTTGSFDADLFNNVTKVELAPGNDLYRNWFGGSGTQGGKGGIGGVISINRGDGLPSDVLSYLADAVRRRASPTLATNIQEVKYKGVSSLFFWDPHVPTREYSVSDGRTRTDDCGFVTPLPGEAATRTHGGFYLGFDRKLQNFDFRVERILKRGDGSAQWYPAKAIPKTITTSELVVRDKHIDTGGILEKNVRLYTTLVGGSYEGEDRQTTWVSSDNMLGQWLSAYHKFYERMWDLVKMTTTVKGYAAVDANSQPTYSSGRQGRGFAWLHWGHVFRGRDRNFLMPDFGSNREYYYVVKDEDRFRRAFYYDGGGFLNRRNDLAEWVRVIDSYGPARISEGEPDWYITTGYWGAAIEALCAFRMSSGAWDLLSRPKDHCPYVNVFIIAGPPAFDVINQRQVTLGIAGPDMTHLIPDDSIYRTGLKKDRTTIRPNAMNYLFKNWAIEPDGSFREVIHYGTQMQADLGYSLGFWNVKSFARSVSAKNDMLLIPPRNRRNTREGLFGGYYHADEGVQTWWQELKDFRDIEGFYKTDMGETIKWIYPLAPGGLGDVTKSKWFGSINTGRYSPANADNIYQQLEDDIIDKLVVEKTRITKEKYYYKTPHNLMNPVHILRELLTDPNGKAVPEHMIDDASWRAAADTVFDEKIGCSFIWDRKTAIDAFIKEVKNHIDAEVFVHSQSGLWTIKLLRKDYAVSELPVLDERCVRNISNFSRPLYTELVNKVTTRFKNIYSGVEQSISLPNYGLYRLQGGNLIERQLKYDGFVDVETVSRVLERDLQKLSTPFISCTVEVMEAAIGTLNIADVFLLNWPELGIERVPMRVKQVVLPKDDKTNVLVKCTQDTFDAPPVTAPLGEPEELDTEPPEPSAITRYLFSEAPYYFVDDKLSVYTSQKGYVMSVASPTDATDVVFRTLFSETTVFDESTPSSDTTGFSYSGLLETHMSATDTQVKLADNHLQGAVMVEGFMLISNEIMAIDSYNASTKTYTVIRGVLDTIPKPQPDRAVVTFIPPVEESGQTVISEDLYNNGQQVYGKVVPIGGSDIEPALADVPTTSTVINGRASRPYCPGNIQVTGTDDITITWKHRNRLDVGREVIGFYSNISTDREPFVHYIITLTGPNIQVDLGVVEPSRHEFITHGESYTIPGGVIRTITHRTSAEILIEVKARYSTVDSYSEWHVPSYIHWSTTQPAMPVPSTTGFGFDFGEQFGN